MHAGETARGHQGETGDSRPTPDSQICVLFKILPFFGFQHQWGWRCAEWLSPAGLTGPCGWRERTRPHQESGLLRLSAEMICRGPEEHLTFSLWLLRDGPRTEQVMCALRCFSCIRQSVNFLPRGLVCCHRGAFFLSFFFWEPTLFYLQISSSSPLFPQKKVPRGLSDSLSALFPRGPDLGKSRHQWLCSR